MINWMRQQFCEHVFGNWAAGTHPKYGAGLMRTCLNCEKVEPKPDKTQRSGNISAVHN